MKDWRFHLAFFAILFSSKWQLSDPLKHQLLRTLARNQLGRGPHLFLWLHLKSYIVVVQLFSPVWFFVTPWTGACQAFLSFTISWSLLKLMSIKLMMSSRHLILCLLLQSLPAFNLSQQQGLFQWVGSSHQVAKVLQFQLQHQSLQWIFRVIQTLN